jgi:hypothetical protein
MRRSGAYGIVRQLDNGDGPSPHIIHPCTTSRSPDDRHPPRADGRRQTQGSKEVRHLAYLDHNFPSGGVTVRHRTVENPPSYEFTSLEWTVINLSKHDHVRSITPSRLQLLLRQLLGLGNPAQLADPRLETLRCFAILARMKGFALSAAEIAGFIGAGFQEGHIGLLVSAVFKDGPGVSKRRWL